MSLNICLDSTFLDQTCRTCSRYYNNDTMEFCRIFDDNDDISNDCDVSVVDGDRKNVPSAKIIEIYGEFLIWKLNITAGDGLPQQICRECFDRFRSVKLFREECLDTQKVLESYFKEFSVIASGNNSGKNSPKPLDVLSLHSELPPSPFDADALIEEVSETSGDSPQRSQHSDDFQIIDKNLIYQESTMGTPPQPLFDEIPLEAGVPIDFRTMEGIKLEEEDTVMMKEMDDFAPTREPIVDDNDGDTQRHDVPEQSAFNFSSSDDEPTYTSDEEEQSASDSSSDSENLDDGHRKIRKPLQCKICPDSFRDRKSLGDHQRRAHPQEKPYTCDKCSSSFKCLLSLKQHKTKHNACDTIKCDACPKSFRSQLHLQRHHKNFHLTSTYTCHICHEKFENYTQMRFAYHIRTHGDKRFQCKLCEKSFHQKVHLLNHERTHTNEKPFVCHICGRAYRHQITCQEHILKHADPLPFKCEVCLKGFSQSCALRTHLRLHTGIKPHRCELCGQSFVQKIQYNLHKMTHSGERPFHCKLCNRKFRLAHQLGSHMHSKHSSEINVSALVTESNKVKDEDDHDDDESEDGGSKYVNEFGKFVCRQCGCLFGAENELQLHSKMHREFRQYVCEICSAVFKRQLHLNLHVDSVHLNKRSHTCGYCGKSFALDSNLKVHLKTHNESRKTFSCQYCDKTFLSRKSQNDHEQVHTGEKRFKCHFCDESFMYRGALGQHILTHLEADKSVDDLLSLNTNYN